MKSINVMVVAAVAAIVSTSAFAGGKDAMFYPNGKPVTKEQQQASAAAQARASQKAKIKASHGKAAPVPVSQ